MTETNNELGVTLREIRKAHKMTLKNVADKIGKSIGYLSDFERGKVGIRVSTLVLWCEALGYSVNIGLEAIE